MKGLVDQTTRFHYFYSHALPPSGRASTNLTKIGCRAVKRKPNEETKTIAYTVRIIGLPFSGNQTMIGRQAAEKHLPTRRSSNWAAQIE